MIGWGEIVARVREWGLREDVVEKDYVLDWMLWGIGTDPAHTDSMAPPAIRSRLPDRALRVARVRVAAVAAPRF